MNLKRTLVNMVKKEAIQNSEHAEGGLHVALPIGLIEISTNHPVS